MIDIAHLTIVVAEKKTWPAYLKEGGKVVLGHSRPAGMADEIADDIYRQVQRRVQQLVAEIG